MPIPARVVYDHPALPQAGGAWAHKERALEAERKERLGTKWTCYSCGVRFYDLKKPEPICPKCEADQRESPVFQKKPVRSRAKKATRKKAARRPRLPPLDDDEQVVAAPKDETAKPIDQIDPSEAVSDIKSED